MNYNRNFNYNAHGNDFYFQNNRRNNVDNRIHNDNGNGQSGDYYEAVSDDDDECFGENKLGVERAHRLMSGNNQVQTDQFSSIDLDFDQLPFVPKFSSEIRNTVEAAKNSEGDDSTKTPIVGDWGPHTSKSKPIKNSSQSQPANCPYFPDQSETIIKPIAQAHESKPITASGHDSMLKSEIENSQTTAVTEKVHSSIIIQPSSFSQTNNPVSSNTNSIQSSENYAKLESNLLPNLSNLPSASTATIPAGNELVKVNDNNTNVNASASSSWADENGDPIQGAFDSINEASTASNSCVNIVNNTKVEYVFHVKEKKNGPGSAGNGSNSVVGSASVSDICADGGIPQGTVISSLVNVLSSNNSDSTPLTSQNLNFVDIQDNSGFSDKISDEYDQKRLYEASKNKQELCNLQVENENTASTSASASAIIAVDDSKDALQKKKTEMFAFRRNNFINQPIPCEAFGDMPVAENEQGKSSADKVLESQALNELLREVKQGAERARNYGALAWQKQPIPVVNKRFLKNTLVSTLRQPYKPPTRGGRFQTGLQNNRHKRDDGDNSDSSSSSGSSRSSRSSSRSYSRSSSSSGSYSSSSRRSRGSRSRSRSRRHRSKKGKQPFPGGGGPPPPNAYYDWAAAAYGYPWYDPGAAAAMYYGMGDGGGGSGYPQMYSNDPQFWAAYRDFYGMGGGDGDGGAGRGGFRGGRGFNPRGAGSRGGWGGGRGRGGGGGMMDCDGRWGSRERYSDEEGRSISRSRSKSRSVSPGSQRKRSRRSKSFENSPSSSSTKGKKRRRSRSLERHADEDKGSGRHRSGSVKSGDTIQDGEKQDGSKHKSKSTSGKKMKSESKKTDHATDRKEGEENDDKGDDMKKKKKKHKKTKKHKKSKISSTEDNGEKEKDDSLKADEGQKKVREKSNGDDENKKEEIEAGEKSSEKDDNTAGVKKKKTKSKKKDGHSTKKKLKKCSKDGVNVKEKKGKTQIKDRDSAVDKSLSAKIDAKSDEEIRKSETETTSSTDKMKEGEDRTKEHGGGVKEKDRENNESCEKRGKDKKCEEINKEHVGSVKEKSREKNEGYRIRSKEEKYEDRYREHGGVEKEKGREKNESCRIRSREETEYCSDRSRVREKRYDEYDERTRHNNIDSKRSRDGEKIVHENKGGTGTSSSRRGGKIEEIERRLQERKANQRRQREEEEKSLGGGDANAENMAKRVKNSGAEGSEDNKGDTFVGGKKGESSIPDKEKLGSDVKICESSGKHKTSKQDEGKQKKKKKIVKKKVKTKLKSESRDCDMGGEGVLSELGTSHKNVSESEQIMSQCDGAMNVKKKKKKKVLKRKSEGGGDRDEEMANKTKAKKKKVIKDTSTTETPAKDSLDLEATTPNVTETVSSHTKEMSDKQVSID